MTSKTYDGQKRKKKRRKREKGAEEGVREMIKRRVIQSVKSRGCYFRRNSRTSWQRNGLFRAVDFLLLGSNERNAGRISLWNAKSRNRPFRRPIKILKHLVQPLVSPGVGCEKNKSTLSCTAPLRAGHSRCLSAVVFQEQVWTVLEHVRSIDGTIRSVPRFSPPRTYHTRRSSL